MDRGFGSFGGPGAYTGNSMEMDKLEIQVQMLRDKLDTATQERRDLERELRHVTSELEETELKLTRAEEQIKDNEDKVHDLRLQVREELVRNDKLDQKLEEMNHAEEKIKEREGEAEELRTKLEDQRLILEHTKKALRDERDKTKMAMNERYRLQEMQDEVDHTRIENDSIKRLMAAKDKVLRQKSQIIENIKNTINEYEDVIEVEIIHEILAKKPRLAFYEEDDDEEHQYSSRQTNDGGSSRVHNGRPQTASNNSVNGSSLFETILDDSRPDSRSHSSRKTRPPTASSSSSHKAQHHKHTNHSGSSRYTNSQAHRNGSPNRNNTSHANLNGSASRNNTICISNSPHARNSTYNGSFVDFRSSSDGFIHKSLINSPYCENMSNKHNRQSSQRPKSSQYKHKTPNRNRSPSPRTHKKPSSYTRSISPRSTLSAQSAGTRGSWSRASDTSSVCSSSSRPSVINSNKWIQGSNETPVIAAAMLEVTSDEDKQMVQFINMGDRVFVDVSRTKDNKKAMKGGVIKYIGHLDMEVDSFRIYVGVRLDDPAGDNDGLFKGKRYFTVGPKYGKFVRIDKVTSVYNKKQSKYIDMDELMEPYREDDNESVATSSSTIKDL